MVSFPGTGVDPLVPQNLIFIFCPWRAKEKVFLKFSLRLKAFYCKALKTSNFLLLSGDITKSLYFCQCKKGIKKYVSLKMP